MKKEVEILKLEMSKQIELLNGTYYKYEMNNDKCPELKIKRYKSKFCSNLTTEHIIKVLNQKLYVENFLMNKVCSNNRILVVRSK